MGASLVEWTGYYETAYVWDAFQNGNTVGFHYDWVGDSWLWAHEGAHGVGFDDEAEASQRADECLQIEG